MSTHSVVGYQDESTGQFRGTYIQFDGDPENMVPGILKRIHDGGVSGLREWIETGIVGNGYRSVESVSPYGDLEEGQTPHVWGRNESSVAYTYLVNVDGLIEVL